MTTRTLIPLIVAFILLLLAAGLYGGLYYLLGQGRATATQLATQVASKTQELERNRKARGALATLATDEAVLRQYSLGKDEIVPFLETLQATGRRAGASLQVLSVSDEKVGTHNRIALSLSITGSFDAVMRTLGAIEYGPNDGVVNDLTLSSGVPNKNATVWSANATYSVGVRATSTPSKP